MTVGHIVVFVVEKIYAVSLGRKKWRINEVTLRHKRHKLSQSQNTLGADVDEEREK